MCVVQLSTEMEGTWMQRLMTIHELSDYLQIPVQTLYGWRHERTGPPALKVGRALRYRQTDVDQWLANDSKALHLGSEA